MKATLSYIYVGERFPELSNTEVVVKEIADMADVSYTLVKNRMGMKRRRTLSLQSVVITDNDLLPMRRNRNKKDATKTKTKSEADSVETLSARWLKRPLL